MPQAAEKFLPSRLARAGILLFALVSLVALTAAEWLTLALAVLTAALIWLQFASGRHRQQRHRLALGRSLSLVIAGLLCLAFWAGKPAPAFWAFALPLVLFALWPLWLAVLLTLSFVFLLMVLAANGQFGPEHHQLIPALILTTLLSGVFIFLRNYKAAQLAPLRRTDELTQAASRDYLSADLHKEIQRSEREGTDMSVIMIGLDTHLYDRHHDADIRAILPRIGRYLHAQLRDFDSYYRVADLQFLIILPGNRTAEAATKAEKIRKGLRELIQSYHLELTVSAGIAGLNIGDDANSLQHSAAHALRRAQQQGGNRCQSYSTWSTQSSVVGGPAQ
ncbi:MAG: diguanylate cyclase [Marinobacter sp.]|nr:diguanylate cyclase [Marinobacter sp.]